MNKLDKDYIKLLKAIKKNGIIKKDRTGTGTVSIFGREIKHKMSRGFPLLTTKKMAFKGIVTELLWFLRGDTNIKWLLENKNYIWVGDAYKNYLNNTQPKIYIASDNIVDKKLTKEEFINEILNNEEFALKYGELGHIYGAGWRRWNTNKSLVIGHTGEQNVFGYEVIDQLSNLITDLKFNPDSRRLMVDAWKVDEIKNVVLPPCHYGFQCYTRELSDSEMPKRALSLKWNQRSVDTPLGLPFNIASYGLLLLILSKITNMVPDRLIGSLGDTHIYLNQVDGVNEQITRNNVFDLPEIELDGEFNNIEKYWVDKEFKLDEFLTKITYKDIKLKNYSCNDKIEFILSN